MIVARALVSLLGLVLATLPVLEKICDLACAAPALREAPAAPRCHPAPAGADSQERDHPCEHSHQVDALVSSGAFSRIGMRSALEPAALTAAISATFRLAPPDVVARAVEPSESPRARKRSSVLRL